MSLTYGGVSLLYDQNGHVARFLDRFQSLDDLRDQTMPISSAGQRDRLRSHNQTNVSAGNPNYPSPPTLRINQLYWPTGAARWSVGYFLATGKNKDKIVKKAWSANGNEALELKATFGDQTFKANLHLLTPRQISCVPKEESLWLLPLVDDRYWWQYRHFGDNEVTTSTTWANLFSTLGTQLGATITAETVDSAYLKPDAKELSRRYDSPAMMADAVAHSVGQRIVRLPAGTVKSQAWSTAETQHGKNTTGKDFKPWWRICGGDVARHPVPANVVVVFAKVVYGKHCKNEVKAYTVSPTDSSLKTTSGTSKMIYSTTHADFSTGGGTADNDTELDALADKIAADYYASIKKAYDQTFAGVKLWEPTAYDDHLLYQFGCEYQEASQPVTSIERQAGEELIGHTVLEEQFEKLTFTRVQSLPVNFGVEFQLSQDTDVLQIDGDVIKCKTDETLTSGSNATCSIWEDDSDTGDNIEVYLDWAEGAENVSSGKEIFAYWSPEECKWNWLGGECEA